MYLSADKYKIGQFLRGEINPALQLTEKYTEKYTEKWDGIEVGGNTSYAPPTSTPSGRFRAVLRFAQHAPNRFVFNQNSLACLGGAWRLDSHPLARSEFINLKLHVIYFFN